MKLGKARIQIVLDHDNPLVRCLGLLYLRYVLKPTVLWQYFESHLDDPTEVVPGFDKRQSSVGQFAARLLSEIRFYNTSLPRLPKQIQQIFSREIVKREILHKRDAQNEFLRDDIDVGNTVLAQYPEDWQYYPATVEELMEDGRFLVTFEGYEEQEEVSIGMLKVENRKRDRRRRRSRSRSPERSRRRDRRSRDRRSDEKNRRSRDRDRRSKEKKGEEYPEALTNDVLDKIIKERQSRSAVSIGRNYVPRPPMGLKRQLSTMATTSSTRKRGGSRSPGRSRRGRYKPLAKKTLHLPEKKKSSQPSEEHMMRMKKLMEKYGHDPNANSTTMK